MRRCIQTFEWSCTHMTRLFSLCCLQLLPKLCQQRWQAEQTQRRHLQQHQLQLVHCSTWPAPACSLLLLRALIHSTATPHQSGLLDSVAACFTRIPPCSHCGQECFFLLIVDRNYSSTLDLQGLDRVITNRWCSVQFNWRFGFILKW